MDIHHYFHPDDRIYGLIKEILQREKKIMTTMQDLQNQVSQQSTVEDSVITMLQGLQQQIKDANNSNDPAAMDKVLTDLQANTKKLSDAVATNTVASPDTATQSQTATPSTAR